MSTPDPSFNQWKEEMRQDALENELKRIKKFSSRQSGMIQRQRRALLFISLFFIALFLLLTFNGIIQWPQQNRLNDPVQTALSVHKSPESLRSSDTNGSSPDVGKAYRTVNPSQDTITLHIPEDGILFSIQIGAFNDMNLDRFVDNMVSIYQDKNEGINQLSLGVFPDYPDAVEFLEIVKKIGFEDAFVMANRFGRRVKIQEALMIRQKAQPNSKSGISNRMTQFRE